MQYFRKKGEEASMKTKVCRKVLQNIFLVSDFLDLEFQTIKIQFFWAKSKKIQTFYNSKACFGVPESYWNTPTKT